MRLVIDMNLSTDGVTALRADGIDASHLSTIGSQDAADDVIMEWARTNDAIVLTRDLDFGAALTRQGLISPSVIQIRTDQVRVARHLPLVRRILAEQRQSLEAGAIVTLEDDRVRIRILDANPSL